MKTKNIQDVVAEKVEEFENHFCYEQDGEMIVTCFEPRDCTIEDWPAWQIKDWLTDTLTQLVKEVKAGERERNIEILNKVEDTAPNLLVAGALCHVKNLIRDEEEKFMTEEELEAEGDDTYIECPEIDNQ